MRPNYSMDKLQKKKINKWDIKVKNFCNSKETPKWKKKKKPTWWEKNSAKHVSDKGSILNIYTELIQSDNKKKQSNFKMNRRTRCFSEKTYRWPIGTWKDTQHHQSSRNTNQNHNETSHFPPIRMVIIKNTRDNTYWKGCGEKGSFIYCWCECKLVQPIGPLCKIIWRLLRKIKIDLTYGPAILLLSIYPKKMKT